MNIFKEMKEQRLVEAYECFKQILKSVPEDRNDDVHVYVHTKEGDGRVCIQFGGSFVELENGESKPHYFPRGIIISDVKEMLRQKGYRFKQDINDWLFVNV